MAFAPKSSRPFATWPATSLELFAASAFFMFTAIGNALAERRFAGWPPHPSATTSTAADIRRLQVAMVILLPAGDALVDVVFGFVPFALFGLRHRPFESLDFVVRHLAGVGATRRGFRGAPHSRHVLLAERSRQRLGELDV